MYFLSSLYYPKIKFITIIIESQFYHTKTWKKESFLFKILHKNYGINTQLEVTNRKKRNMFIYLTAKVIHTNLMTNDK